MRRLLFLLIPFASAAQPPEASGELVTHTYYCLDYSEENEQARWVYYVITPENLSGPGKRADNFKPDPAVSTGSAGLSDYRGSGYDRGHLCPAAAMKQNQQAMDETFYLSNMSPQAAALNRGKWAELEKYVRDQARECGSLEVVTGPVFDSIIGRIGQGVTVPGFYYKALLCPGRYAEAYIMPNRAVPGAVKDYKITVDDAERITGIDFFPGTANEELEK